MLKSDFCRYLTGLKFIHRPNFDCFDVGYALKGGQMFAIGALDGQDANSEGFRCHCPRRRMQGEMSQSLSNHIDII